MLHVSVVSSYFLCPRHPVDHDVGQAIASPPPHSQAVAIESDAMVPVKSLLRIISLKHDKDSLEIVSRWVTKLSSGL